MAILISTQKQMLDRRRALTDCYICGSALPPKGPGWRSQVVAEHIVPKTLLGVPPEDQAAAWPVELYVHVECEERHKHRRDHLVKILHKLGNLEESWSEADVGLLARSFGVSRELQQEGGPVHSITGGDDALLAPVLWTRGMHAALYGSVLPNTMGFVTNAPVPVWSDASGGAQQGLHDYEIRKKHLLGFLIVAIHAKQVDEIRAWGGNLVYQCAWRQSILKLEGEWACVWALEFQGVSEWAMKARGVDAPWHGYYEIDDLPPGCAVIGQSEIDNYNRWANNKKVARNL